jgi:hypothetical protein
MLSAADVPQYCQTLHIIEFERRSQLPPSMSIISGPLPIFLIRNLVL